MHVQIDTGSNRTIITQEAAQNLGLAAQAEINSASSLFGWERTSSAIVGSVALDAAAVSNVKVFYPKRDPSLTGPVLGMDVLSRFDILFDFPRQKMYLKRPAAIPTPLVPSGSA